MSRDNIRKIGIIVVFVALAVLVVCFDVFKAALSQMMMGQADSLVDQLLR
jgi:hypothetical protein